MPTVSVIICTRNRAGSLAQTLQAFNAVSVPAGLTAEILVVDNGSTDQTGEVVRKHSASTMPVRYVLETAPGLSKARNAGLMACQSDLILFTDDDVIPAANWLECVTCPLLTGECDAVTGRVELAPEIERPWMTVQHKISLAVCDGPRDGVLELVGANMGFRRGVLDRVPQFDTELGAGALGFGEESLFSWQLVEAGFRLRYLPHALVIHRPDADRLTRSNWLGTARKHGLSKAYLLYHWQHKDLKSPRMRACYVAAKLRLRRIAQPQPPLSAEGVAPWEFSYIVEIERCRHFMNERKRPRNYSKRGLKKQTG